MPVALQMQDVTLELYRFLLKGSESRINANVKRTQFLISKNSELRGRAHELSAPTILPISIITVPFPQDSGKLCPVLPLSWKGILH